MSSLSKAATFFFKMKHDVNKRHRGGNRVTRITFVLLLFTRVCFRIDLIVEISYILFLLPRSYMIELNQNWVECPVQLSKVVSSVFCNLSFYFLVFRVFSEVVLINAKMLSVLFSSKSTENILAFITYIHIFPNLKCCLSHVTFKIEFSFV